MKRIFIILIASVLALPACSTAPSNSSSNTRQTPVAQIQVQPTQAQSVGVQPADTSTATSAPATETPMPASTATPAATADTSRPSGLNVISSQGYAMNDGFYIVGELLNNTSAPMGNIKLTATYYFQRAGKPVEIGTKIGTSMLDVIPAYGKAPFVIGPFVVTNSKFGPVTWFDLHEDGQNAALPRQDLTLLNSNSYAAGSWLYVRGEIQNTGTTDAKFVKAVITLYNSSDKVIGAITTYTNPSTVPAGSYAPFTASTEYWPGFDHLTVQIQAQ
jgi:hypothetical protein